MGGNRGYTRARVRACGAGAAEVWAGLLEDQAPGDAGPATVGAVGPVYDRSAYLELAAADGADRLGPPLVLLAAGGLDGPLVTTAVPEGQRALPVGGLKPGDRVRLWPAAGATRERPRYVVRVGDTLDLLVDPDQVAPVPPDDPRYHDLADLRRGTAVPRRGLDALDLLAARGVEDGLGWLADVTRHPDGRELPGDLEPLVDGWVTCLRGAGAALRAPPTDLLGRGPGATPSGDDIVAGLLLALRRTTAGAARVRLRAAGERVVVAASDRTTAVSTALLAQAVRGRTTPTVEAALRGLLAPDVPRAEWAPAVRAAADLGHTSGVDTLLGALLVSLAVGPRLAERS